MGQDKARETAYSLSSWANQTQLGENLFDLLPDKIYLDNKKQRQKMKRTLLP